MKLPDHTYGKWVKVPQTPQDKAMRRHVYERRWPNGDIDIHVVVEVDDVLDENARLRAESSPHERFSDFHHVANIPVNMFWWGGFAEAMQQHDDRWVRKVLNDADFRYLKTTDKRL